MTYNIICLRRLQTHGANAHERTGTNVNVEGIRVTTQLFACSRPVLRSVSVSWRETNSLREQCYERNRSLCECKGTKFSRLSCRKIRSTFAHESESGIRF